jgi:hypothetical protein
MNIFQNKLQKYKQKNKKLNNQISGTNIELDTNYEIKILSETLLETDIILNKQVKELQKKCFSLDLIVGGAYDSPFIDQYDEPYSGFGSTQLETTHLVNDSDSDNDIWILILSNNDSLCFPTGNLIAALMFRKSNFTVYNVCTIYECRGKQYNSEKSYVSCLFDILKKNLTSINDGVTPSQIFLDVERIVNFPSCDDPEKKSNIIQSYFNGEITHEEYDNIYANTKRINPQFCRLIKIYEKQGFMFDSESYLNTKMIYNNL